MEPVHHTTRAGTLVTKEMERLDVLVSRARPLEARPEDLGRRLYLVLDTAAQTRFKATDTSRR